MRERNNYVKSDGEKAFNEVKLIEELYKRNSEFIPLCSAIFDSSKILLNARVAAIFRTYTLHDINHSVRIMEYMYGLITDITLLNDFEITLLILAAILHDIGMAVSQEDIDIIKADKCSLTEIKYTAIKKSCNDDDELALMEFVRRIHGDRSGEYIQKNIGSQLCIGPHSSLNFSEELATICVSHTKDFSWIRKKCDGSNKSMGDYSFNLQYIACLLRLGDILDIDTNRTPYNLYQSISPKGESDKEWQQHYVIQNNKKIVENPTTGIKNIHFEGKCNNPEIHQKLLSYIGNVSKELSESVAITTKLEGHYHLNFYNKVEIKLDLKGFTYINKIALNYRAITSLLTGEKLYGDRKMGLRELIQNSIDACKIREELEQKEGELGKEPFLGKIKILLDKTNGQVTIADNGIGMNFNIVNKHFLSIGESYYLSNDFKSLGLKYNPIGNYGIGFLSCFMLSENVKIYTRSPKERFKNEIELSREKDYFTVNEIEDYSFEGTRVTLDYNQFLSAFENDIDQVRYFVSTYFITDDIKIQLFTDSGKQLDILNSIHQRGKNKNLTHINADRYLQDVVGDFTLKKKTHFIYGIENIDFEEPAFLFDDFSLIPVAQDNGHKLSNFITDHKLTTLRIPLVKKALEKEYLAAIPYEKDTDNLIEMMQGKLEWINILVPPEYKKTLTEKVLDKNSPNIFGNLKFAELENLGHASSCKTKMYVKEIGLFEGIKDRIYMPFDNHGAGYFYLYPTALGDQMLYLRSVLIKDFQYDIKEMQTVFEVNQLRLNIKNSKIIPDVTRNNLTLDLRDKISYSIAKAIHQSIKTEGVTDKEQQYTIDEFIKYYYKEIGILEKLD